MSHTVVILKVAQRGASVLAKSFGSENNFTFLLFPAQLMLCDDGCNQDD